VAAAPFAIAGAVLLPEFAIPIGMAYASWTGSTATVNGLFYGLKGDVKPQKE
jgi:hypothetical protein